MRRCARLAALLGLLGLLCLLPARADDLPAPPTAAQAFTPEQLLQWIGALEGVTRESLETRLPARFEARQESRFRVSWRADTRRVRTWFGEVEFLDAGDEAICIFRMQPGNGITRPKAQSMLGNFEPLPAPSPPPLSPTQGPIANPVFDRVYLRRTLSARRTLTLVFEPLERGGALVEAVLRQPAVTPP